jgi:hypothetical protein
MALPHQVQERTRLVRLSQKVAGGGDPNRDI